jgi:H+/Cl- antiporter ClcA
MRFDRVLPSLSEVRSFSVRILPYWVAAALTALVSVVFAKAFGWSEHWAMAWTGLHPLWVFWVIPLTLVASAAMADFFSPLAAGSGIPQLIAAVEVAHAPRSVLDKLLGIPVIVVKFVGSCLCVAGGGVTGREGPMLQVAAGIFYWVQSKWPNGKMKLDARSMILAGGAAGLASAFNTPLGGIIFAIEELAKVHITQVRTWIFHSVIISGILSQAFLGDYLYLGRLPNFAHSFSTILPMALAMILIGAAGAVFGSSLVRLNDWRTRQDRFTKYTMTIFFGLLVATIFYLKGSGAIGSGRHVIVDLLEHPEEPATLGLGFARAFGNFFTYASGIIGGIFAPALSTGAALGSWMSTFIEGAQPQVWILGGMVAFLTGVTRTPFTSLILVLEMTDSHGIILDLMVAGILAQGGARLIDQTSFYEHMAHRITKKLGVSETAAAPQLS